MVSKKVTLEEIQSVVQNFLDKAKRYDIVICIGKNGTLPAMMISKHQATPFVYYSPSTEKSFEASISQVDLDKIMEVLDSTYNQNRILMVTDIIDTGRTITFALHEVMRFLSDNMRMSEVKIDVFSLHGNIDTVNTLRKMFKSDNIKITFGLPKKNKWIIYPWEKETD